MAIVPLRGEFENVRAMLARIMERDDVAEFAGIIFTKDGDAIPAIFGCSRERLAYTAVTLGTMVQEPFDE